MEGQGNQGNLKPVRSKDEARERGQQGGRKSGESRRKKRDAKETARLFLDMAATGNLDDILAKLNIKKSARTNLMGIIARHVLTAQSGNVNSARLVLEIAGELQNKGMENSFNLNIGKDEEDCVKIYLPENGRD